MVAGTSTFHPPVTGASQLFSSVNVVRFRATVSLRATNIMYTVRTVENHIQARITVEKGEL